MWTIDGVIFCAHYTKCIHVLDCSAMRSFIQGDLGGNIRPFSLRRAATRGSSAFLALELQPAGEKDISTCWGRVGGLFTGGKKRNWSELLFPVKKKRPCCALGLLPEVTLIWSESRTFGNDAYLHRCIKNPSRDEDLTFPFHCVLYVCHGRLVTILAAQENMLQSPAEVSQAKTTM